MIKKKIYIIFILGIFLISLISAYPDNSEEYTGLIEDLVNLLNSRPEKVIINENTTIEYIKIPEPIIENNSEISFYNKKYSNQSGIIIIADKEYQPIWDGNRTYYEIEFEIRGSGNKKDLKDIKDFVKDLEKYNPEISYSYNYEILNETIKETYNEIENKLTIEQIDKKIYSNYVILDKIKDIDLTNSASFKLRFEKPRYSREKFNITISDNKDGTYTLDPDLGECGTISSAGYYTLNQSVNSSTTCFTISAPNVTLDCAGYWINYSIGGTANTYGITTNQFNTTIKNCNIVDGNWTSTTISREGIYYNGADNGTIYNNTVFANSSNAIYLYLGTNFNNLTNNTLTSNTASGIYLNTASNNTLIRNNGTSLGSGYGIALVTSSNNNTLISNTGTSNTGNGIVLSSSSNNNLTGNNGTSSTGLGIYLLTSQWNNLKNNIGTTSSTTGNYGGIRMDSGNNTLTNNTGISTASQNGIILYGASASDNILTGNNGTGATGIGIRVYIGSNNILTENRGISTSSVGIYVDSGASNNTLINNIGISASSYGIDLAASSNNTLIGNNGTSSTGSGIYLVTGQFNNLTNNTGMTASTTTNQGGIRIDSGNNTLINNTGISTASTPGIILYSAVSSDNILIGNNGTSVSGYAFYMRYGWRNVLTGNIGRSNANYGIFVQDSYENNLTSNIGFSNAYYGIALYMSDNNTLISNNATGTTYGFNFVTSNNNLLINQAVKGTFTIQNVKNTMIRDCGSIDGIVSVAVTASSINNTFLNCSYTTESVDGAGNYLIRKWYYRAYVNDTFGNDMNNANVSAYNSTGTLEFTQLTNSSGLIDRKEITEYVNRGGTKTYANNYTINATSGLLGDSHQLNVTQYQNKLDDFFTLTDISPPTWITIPNNQTITYGTDWSGVTFNATDDLGSVDYYVNDTRFSINSTGFLDNSSALAGGIYTLLITANDTAGNNIYSSYRITINKLSTSLLLSASNGWSILASTTNTITGSVCPDASCKLYEAGTEVSNPFFNIFPAGNYLFVYNTTGNENFTAGSIQNTLIAQVNATSGINGTITTTQCKKIFPNNRKLDVTTKCT